MKMISKVGRTARRNKTNRISRKADLFRCLRLTKTFGGRVEKMKALLGESTTGVKG